MKFNVIFLVVNFLFVTALMAQDKEEVLFTVDGEEVYTSEFIRVFQKNKDIVVENENKDFDDYLDLFVSFKLKIKQAYELQLDTSSAYKNELLKYREQLISPYLQNPKATEELIKEAYERTITEINASHILIKVSSNAKPADTLLAYQKISEARNKAINGIPFEEVAKQYSEDPSAQSNAGNLGYFSSFSMVYSFENAGYQTNVGEVSKPFRTQFGYHILKVNDKRNSKGEVQVAHIMVKLNPEDSLYAKNKIDDIYNKLKQGDDFGMIAQKHSDDASSSKKDGILPQFGTGKMIKSFEIVAFNLQNEGDFSKPFKTEYGWHILKLLKKFPVGSYDELYQQLSDKIKNGSRSKYVVKALANDLKKGYQITESPEVLSQFYLSNNTEMRSEKTLFTIENNEIKSKEFYSYILKNKNKSMGDLYDDFKNQKIIEYYKDHLEETNVEFANIYQEYKDGLLLFELLQKNIWERSENDSIGLHNYYEINKDKYLWKKRGELSISSCTSMDKAIMVKQYLEENITIDEIKKMLNEGARIHVLFSSGVLEEGNSKLPEGFVLLTGVSKIYEEENNQFTIVKVDRIIDSTTKKFDETKGEVMNDYQNYLEKDWTEGLHKKYKVKLNKKAYKKLKSKYGNK